MGKMKRRTKAAEALSRARGAFPSDPLEDRKVIRLTHRLLELRRQMFSDAVDTVVELGEILRQGRVILAGHYRRWLDQLAISRATARNYERLALTAEEDPRLIQRFKELGTTKLYRLAVMNPEGRKSVLGRGKTEDLRALTAREFAALTASHVKRTRKVTADMRAHGLRMKVRSWAQTLHRTRIGRIRSPELRADLKETLEGIASLAGKLARDL
jgi:hypothetical protein